MISVKPTYNIFSIHIETSELMRLANYLANCYLLRTSVIYRLTLFVSMSSFFSMLLFAVKCQRKWKLRHSLLGILRVFARCQEVLKYFHHFNYFCKNPLSSNPTKWSNTRRQFVRKSRLFRSLTILWGWRLKG